MGTGARSKRGDGARSLGWAPVIVLVFCLIVAVPLLDGCGSGAAADQSDTTSSASLTMPVSTAPPAHAGPVLDGQTFTMTLPPGGHVDKKQMVAWSHGWDMGDDWSLDGVVTEQSCGGDCQEDTAATRAQEARLFLQDRHTEHEKRMPDVTVGGITMVHTSGHKGKTANEEYGAQYQGRDYRFDFEIDLRSGSRQHVEALIQQILASITFKG